MKKNASISPSLKKWGRKITVVFIDCVTQLAIWSETHPRAKVMIKILLKFLIWWLTRN